MRRIMADFGEPGEGGVLVHHLRAAPYQRTEQRQGYANGFEPKRVKARIGGLDLAVPQARATRIGACTPWNCSSPMRTRA